MWRKQRPKFPWVLNKTTIIYVESDVINGCAHLKSTFIDNVQWPEDRIDIKLLELLHNRIRWFRRQLISKAFFCGGRKLFLHEEEFGL